MSDTPLVSHAAPDALAAARAGTTTLIDIRTPEEWTETGVGEGATAIMMQDPDFVEKVSGLVNGDRTAPVTLICRTGARTARTAAYLRDIGFTNVSHVGEGMIGSGFGPGWVNRGLPVVRR